MSRPLPSCRGHRALGRRRARWVRAAAVSAAAAAIASGCGASYSEPDPAALPDPVTVPSTTLPPAGDCDDKGTPPAVASFTPLDPLPGPGALPTRSKMAEIRDRGRLIVGTSIDTLLFASVDPQTNQIVGFDVDMARLVASAIFGIPADSEALNARIELRGITYGDRIPLVASGEVDLIAHTMTINCRRWQQGVAFSAVYLNAGQKLLVAKDSPATTMDDLRGQVVCASAGGTSADELEAAGAQVAAVGNQTDCLVKLQRGEVAAIRSDDTVLAGFAAQDPNTKVVGEFLTEEPYGLATDADHPEFTQFVNAVLAAAKADGRWQASYDRWLAPALGAPVADLTTGERGIPQPNYSRPLPN